MEPEGSLPHSQMPATSPDPQPDQSSPKSQVGFSTNWVVQKDQNPRTSETFHRSYVLKGEELLAPRSTPPHLEDHPLSAVRNC
jgi:hypothetical protein